MSVLTENKLSPQEEISILKNTKNAVILAHYYQEPEIQEIADFVGDSLELAKKAATTNADIIVFAGVHFMAETAKILNPSKKVLLPDLNAGCSLAESCPPEAFQQLKDKYPDHVVVTYINCSAEIKAMSDVVCTSSNAERVINSIPLDKPIIFAPDKNLGRYLIEKTGRKMLLWDGACIVHEAFSIDKLLELYAKYPSAKIIAHPESEEHILKIANYIGSTSGMLNFVKSSDQDTFIVATEAGILHQMQMDVPDKLYNCLKDESPEIVLAESLMKAAHRPIKRMMEL
ncbi:quinolinate synthase NadA [uncultured Salegentibacter sp.]|uniref:quinolinate synthase NadA n=1 Tax=uncultured Salegentibacter sp. TaxID=259320 RepID=UPI0030DB5553